MLRIAHVSAEFGGLAQTGGLADAVAALSTGLSRVGHDVRVFLPLYGASDSVPNLETELGLEGIVVALGGSEFEVAARTIPPAAGDPTIHLIDCPAAYGRDRIYDDAGDEHLRFALLARAALECCQRLDWPVDLLHCHDWHAALLPWYLQEDYRWDRLFAGSRTVLTIHNLAYQGAFAGEVAAELGLRDERRWIREDGSSGETVNFLATGIRCADAVTTVSPTYAREILTPEDGMGLDRLLQECAGRMTGILNGVDYDIWDPRHDPLIPENYTAEDLAGKRVCRQKLLDELGLQPDPRGPVMGIVSRLAHQKGFELVGEVLPDVLEREDVRLAVLGTGDEELQELFERLEASSPGKVAFQQTFDPALAHRIEAGSDLFLMPSRFEPCGLNQMYSLRYGTPPIVHRVGGLADTVEPFDEESGDGTGFVFSRFGAAGFRKALEDALLVYRDPVRWRRLMANGMARDFSWSRQIERYVALYRQTLQAPSRLPEPGAPEGR